MKKHNTLMTIALGALVTVTVAAVAIVWSGNVTKEKPDAGMESTNRPDDGHKVIEQLQVEEPTEAEEQDDPEENVQENPLHGRWEVTQNEYPSNFVPQKPPAANLPETEKLAGEAAGNPPAEQAEPAAGTDIYSLNFAVGETMSWPVQGNVIQYYSMDTTVYFPTLEQYKCSPAIQIQSEAGTPVMAPVNAKIVQVGEDVKIGGFIRMEIGNDYQIILGQLTDICVKEGDYVARGAQLGTVAAPTRYYVVEGDNLYFQMLYKAETVDPLDYLE